LIYQLLKTKHKKVFLAGNMGLSPLDILKKTSKDSFVVLELSSFELENLKKSPQVAVVTNIFPDHLNRYESFESYKNAKKNIFRHQEKNDILVLNIKNKELASQANSRVYFFSKSRTEGLKLAGEHNLENIAAAETTAKALGVDPEKAVQVLRDFKGVPYRQELAARISGVDYYNDTAATNPGSATAGLNVLSEKYKRIILIAGGEDKNLDYEKFASVAAEKAFKIILLPGSATEKIKKALKQYESVLSMKEAVKKAASFALRGDAVLLSPAAASFNLFKNEFDRGDCFVREVKKLK